MVEIVRGSVATAGDGYWLQDGCVAPRFGDKPLRDDTNDRHCADDEILLDWRGSNFIGEDLSRLAVGYAQSVQSRWGLGGLLTFVVESAEDFLARIGDSYQGRVALVMLQFPMPYRF